MLDDEMGKADGRRIRVEEELVSLLELMEPRCGAAGG
jgi:hypothetical protein